MEGKHREKPDLDLNRRLPARKATRETTSTGFLRAKGQKESCEKGKNRKKSVDEQGEGGEAKAVVGEIHCRRDPICDPKRKRARNLIQGTPSLSK